MNIDSCRMCTKWDEERDLRIAELDECYVVLNRDQFFPGYTFVFTKEHVTELFHLERERRIALMDEVAAVALALDSLFKPDKINYELLGNMVPHMHWHIVPRYASDPLWPRPIWAEGHEEKPLSAGDYMRRIEMIGKAIKI